MRQQCIERNQAAVAREIASRMQRLQFHDYDEIGKPMNLINLQNRYVMDDQFDVFTFFSLRTRADFHLLIHKIKSDTENRDLWRTELTNLLNK